MLLDAADAVFFAGDWERASLESIAARAGVSKQTLLRHFGSKAGLLEAGAQRGVRGRRRPAARRPGGDVDGAVANLLDHYEERGDRALKLGAMEGDGALAGWSPRARSLHYEWVEHAFGPWLARAAPAGAPRACAPP